MNRKSGFTLIELMATLSILLLLITMVGSIFVQGYKIINRTDNKAAIQDEVRNAIINIEAETTNAKEIKIRTADAITNYDGKEAKEILYVKKDNEYILYFEIVNSDEYNSLIEVKYGIDNSIKSEKVLLNNIKVSNSSKFSLKVTEVDKLININFEGVLVGNQLSGQDYILTLSKEKNKDIIVNFQGNGSDSSDSTIDPIDPVIPEEPDENTPNSGEVNIDFKISNSWNGGAEYIITITNNTSNEIIAWELIFESDVEFTSCYDEVLEKTDDGRFKIKSNQNSGVIEINKSVQIKGQCKGYIDRIKNLSIRTW